MIAGTLLRRGVAMPCLIDPRVIWVEVDQATADDGGDCGTGHRSSGERECYDSWTLKLQRQTPIRVQDPESSHQHERSRSRTRDPPDQRCAPGWWNITALAALNRSLPD